MADLPPEPKQRKLNESSDSSTWYVSNRFATEPAGFGDALMLHAFMRYDSNAYNESSNPEGIVSVGVSHNGHVLDLIEERLSRPDCHQWSQQLVRYPSSNLEAYSRKFTLALSQFLTWRAKPAQPIEKSDVLVNNGTGTSLDCFCHAACDPGDYVMVPTPYYGGFDLDICSRAKVKIYPVDCSSSNDYLPTIKLLEDTLVKARSEGCNVKVLLITNPSNPVGVMLSREQIQEMIEFCHQNQLHYVSDEIYMNSVHNESAEFVSALSIDNIPDPNAVHLLWGFSKDFGMPGFQVGCLVTRCQPIKDYMRKKSSMFQQPASYVRQMLTVMINDKEWLENIYFLTNMRRLREHLEMTIEWLKKNKLPFIRPTGGLYIFVNFSKLLSDVSHEAEVILWNKFFDAGVYITPGKAFHCTEPGWFRIVFAEEPSLLKLALQRMQVVLDST